MLELDENMQVDVDKYGAKTWICRDPVVSNDISRNESSGAWPNISKTDKLHRTA